jgi:hypothetical protein
MIIILIPFLLGLCLANEALKKHFLKNFILTAKNLNVYCKKKLKPQTAYL